MTSWPKNPDSAVRCRPLLGTYVVVEAGGLPEEAARAAIGEAFAEVERVQRLMSFHDPASDVSRLNTRASQGPVPVHRDTFLVLEAAARIRIGSGGVFDVSVGGPLVRAGFLPRPAGAPRPRLGACGEDIKLLSRNRVRFHRPLWVDLGGIAKGFAVDRAFDVLSGAGAAEILVNAGGDMRFRFRRPRPLFVRHPREPRQARALGLFSAGALATSAPTFSRRRGGGRWATPYHVPGARWPEDLKGSVTVFSKTCLTADALAKVAALAPGSSLPERLGARVFRLP